MLIKESMLRRVIREEAIKSLREQTGGYLSAGLAGLGSLGALGGGMAGPLGGTVALGAGAYRGYQNTQTRSAGLVLRYQDAAKPDTRLAGLETDVRLVLYGGSAVSSFFNMTAGAGMFAKDLALGDGGDFADMAEAGKEQIVKQTYEATKSNTLTADSFYQIVSQAFEADPDMADDNPPQKEASMTTQGTDTFFAMLSEIQSRFASGAPAAVDPNAPPPPAAGPAKDWPSYVAATPKGGKEVQAAWTAYAAAMGVNAGFGTFARWYQANAKGQSPQQAATTLSSLAKQPRAASGGTGTPAVGGGAAVAVTAADNTAHPAEAAAVKAADAEVAAAEADPNPLTKKQKIAAAIAKRQAARAALVAARQAVRAVRKENLFHSNDSRLNESNRQLKNLKIVWGK